MLRPWVRGIKPGNFHDCPIHLLVHEMELPADNEIEAREKLHSIYDGLKVVQDDVLVLRHVLETLRVKKLYKKLQPLF